MKRMPLIAGNWKMFKTVPEAVETATRLADACREIQNVEIMIAPAFVTLPLVAEAVKNTRVHLGAQNLYFEPEGAFTGEISADMLSTAGAEYVIIGHSERRHYFFETDEMICKKIKAAVTGGLKPILCIGETESLREQGKTFLTLDKQVSDGLQGLGPDEIKDLVLAYEPVWAIGTGKSADAAQVEEAHQYLRSLLEKQFSLDLAKTIRILYGGSVKPENINELMRITDVDGALVGGASLDVHTFTKIIKFDTQL
ncbi:MAG: triose-phosphate isomerase [Desulfotignum sp.]|nr:triose-phosphate isomerase [Desulfotignum sp.]MCF8125509.1 triose-phosphate isomerase [Desulfotignum sp.]